MEQKRNICGTIAHGITNFFNYVSSGAKYQEMRAEGSSRLRAAATALYFGDVHGGDDFVDCGLDGSEIIPIGTASAGAVLGSFAGAPFAAPAITVAGVAFGLAAGVGYVAYSQLKDVSQWADREAFRAGPKL